MLSIVKRIWANPFDAMDKNHATGLWGEEVAAKFLRKKGYKIEGKRVRILRDEIDIIASCKMTGNTRQLVFVEVKTRASNLYGGGIGAVDWKKRRAQSRAAVRFMRKKPKTAFRFDVVEVTGSIDSKTPPVIKHHENVFPLDSKYVIG